MATKQAYFDLNNGAKMPKVALGTWKSPPEKTKQAILTAIRTGYRFIDCANDYDNEHIIGEALKELFEEGVINRSDLFIQAKLWNTNHRPEHVELDLNATLKDLQLDYVDSYIIHWPTACPSTGKNVTLRTNGSYLANYKENTMFPCTDEGYFCHDPESHYVETWKAMEKLVDSGKAKSIGLSNFNLAQIQEILHIPGAKYKPAVLQNESHPYLHEKDLRDFCRINGVAFQAYSALGSADRPKGLSADLPTDGYEVLAHPVIVKLAKKYGKSTANIVIRWHLQMDGCLVAKSATPSRIEGNFDVWDFELSNEDMKSFDDLNIGWRHLLVTQLSCHADYPFKESLPYGYVLEKCHFEKTCEGSKD